MSQPLHQDEHSGKADEKGPKRRPQSEDSVPARRPGHQEHPDQDQPGPGLQHRRGPWPHSRTACREYSSALRHM